MQYLSCKSLFSFLVYNTVHNTILSNPDDYYILDCILDFRLLSILDY